MEENGVSPCLRLLMWRLWHLIPSGITNQLQDRGSLKTSTSGSRIISQKLDHDSIYVDHWKSHEGLFVEKCITHSQVDPLSYKQYLQHLEYSLHHLKEIKLVGQRREMDLVRFLLNKSLFLQSFQICSVNRIPLFGSIFVW